MIDMYDLFLNIKILRKYKNKWNVDMQPHAYMFASGGSAFFN